MIAVAEELGVPVDYIGIGEGIDDLQPFNSKEFSEAMFSWWIRFQYKPTAEMNLLTLPNLSLSMFKSQV